MDQQISQELYKQNSFDTPTSNETNPMADLSKRRWITEFSSFLREEGKSESTIRSYLFDIGGLCTMV